MIIENSLATLVACHVADFNIRVIDGYSPGQWEANACIVILAYWRIGIVESTKLASSEFELLTVTIDSSPTVFAFTACFVPARSPLFPVCQRVAF